MSYTGGCITEEVALRFATAKSHASERAAVHAHLDSGCGNCEQLLNRVVHAVDPEAGTLWGKPWCFTTFRKGQLLDNRYRIDRYIDRGGMGEVYEAFDCLLGMRVAVKTVSSTLSDDFEASSLLKAEVQHALRVNHRNVCRIYSLSVHQPPTGPAILFLTMELVEGVTLGSRIDATGKLEPREAVHLSTEILSGMSAAHDAGVLHRDLKSDNIMLRSGKHGRYSSVIMDFGLAVALSDGRSHVSGDKAMVGSLQYMPPEQVQGERLRIESDLYSFGVILFEMLTGKLPFRAEKPGMGGLLKRLLEPAPRVRSFAADVPMALDEIVARCLEMQPKQRYNSAHAVLTALRATGLIEDFAIDSPQPRSSYPPPEAEADSPRAASGGADSLVPSAASPSPRLIEPTLGPARTGEPSINPGPFSGALNLNAGTTHPPQRLSNADSLQRKSRWYHTLQGWAAIGAIGLTLVVVWSTSTNGRQTQLPLEPQQSEVPRPRPIGEADVAPTQGTYRLEQLPDNAKPALTGSTFTGKNESAGTDASRQSTKGGMPSNGQPPSPARSSSSASLKASPRAEAPRSQATLQNSERMTNSQVAATAPTDPRVSAASNAPVPRQTPNGMLTPNFTKRDTQRSAVP